MERVGVRLDRAKFEQLKPRAQFAQEDLLALAFWEGGGWNLEAGEHLALLL